MTEEYRTGDATQQGPASQDTAAYQAAMTQVAKGVLTAFRGRELNPYESSGVEEAVKGAIQLGSDIYGSPEKALQAAASLGYAMAGDVLGGGAGRVAYEHAGHHSKEAGVPVDPTSIQAGSKDYQGTGSSLNNALSKRAYSP